MERRKKSGVHHDLEGTAQLVQPVAPQPPEEEQEPLVLIVRIEFVGGGENVELDGMSQEQVNPIINWYKGNMHNVIDIPLGDELLMIDRANVTHLVVKREV